MKKLLTILFLLIGFIAQSQTYNPANFTTSNKPYGSAQGFPTDGRSYYYDPVNYTYREYQNTAEVLTYLNLAQYRTGQFPIVVNTGGILSGGLITGGVNTLYYFKNGTADSNLVVMIPPSGSGNGTVTAVTASNGSGLTWTITNPTTTPNLTLGLTYGGDVSGTTNALTVNDFNGLPPSFYLNYLNLTNKPTIPAQFNPIAGSNIALSGTYPNISFAVTGLPNTAGTYITLTGGGQIINLDTQHYRKVDTLIGLNDSTLEYTVNGNLYSITLRGGAHGGGGGSGTVTNVSVVTANGVSATVANPTSTPALTFTLGNITPTTVNSLTLAALSGGFTITGGSSPSVLTVPSSATVSGTNTGDITLSGQNYLSLTGQALTANAVNVSGANITGILKAASFPALTGQVTTSAGSLTTTIATNTVTYSNLQQLPAKTVFGNPTSSLANSQATYIGYGLLFNVDTLKIDSTLIKTLIGAGSVTSVALALPSSVFSISGSPVTGSGTLTGTFLPQTANTFFAAPNGSSGTPTFRAMVNADLPTSAVTPGSGYNTFTVNQQGIVTAASVVNQDSGINVTSPLTKTTSGTTIILGLNTAIQDTTFVAYTPTTANGATFITGSSDTIYQKKFIAGSGIVIDSTTTAGALTFRVSGGAGLGTVAFAYNGLSLTSTGDSVYLGGSLVQNTTIAQSTYTLNFTGSGSSSMITATNTGSGAAITGIGGANSGIVGESGSGPAGFFTSTLGYGLLADVDPTSTNTSLQIAVLRHTVSGGGTPSNGIGGYLSFHAATTANGDEESGRIESIWSNATTGSRTNTWNIYGYNNATLQTQLSLLGSGQAQFPQYGKGTFTGTAVYNILEDASGNLIEGAVPVGSSTGAFNGLYLSSTGDSIGFGGTITKNDTLQSTSYGVVMIDSTAGVATLKVLNKLGTSLQVTGASTTTGNVLVVTNNGTQAAISAGNFNGSSNSAVITVNQSGTSVAPGIVINTVGVGLNAISTAVNNGNNSPAVLAQSLGGATTALKALVQDTALAAVDVVSTFVRSIGSGVSNPTVGMGIESDIFLSSASNHLSGIDVQKIKTISTNITDATYGVDYHIGLITGGSFPSTDQFIFHGAGQASFTEYTTSNSALISTSGDTTNYKPTVMDANGNVFRSPSWYGGGGGGTSNGIGRDSTITITSGSSSTVTNGYNVVVFAPTSAISSYTLTLPTTWHTSNLVKIIFLVTSNISAGANVVTSFTVVNGSGQTLSQVNIPTTGIAGETIIYDLISGTYDHRIE